MQLQKPYNFILVAIEYKNIYADVLEFLKDNQKLNSLGLNITATEDYLLMIPPYGAKMMSLSKGTSPASISISQNRVQLDKKDIQTDEIEKIPEIFEELTLARKKITNDENIEFQGAIIRANYKLDDEEEKFFKEKASQNLENLKKYELKLNFLYKDQLNYNLTVRKEGNFLVVDFDVNSKFIEVEKRDFWNIRSIINKILKILEEPEQIELKKMIQII